MKPKYVAFFCIGMFFSCQDSEKNGDKASKDGYGDDYLKKVLNNFDEHSYFIALNVTNANKENYRIVLENSKLYRILNAEKEINKQDYSNKIVNIIGTNSNLYITEKENKELRSYKIDNECESRMSSIKEKEAFFNYYFKNKVIQKELDHTTLQCLINHLFQWQIFCYTDDETGYLVIL